jgi:hypothetical protein
MFVLDDLLILLPFLAVAGGLAWWRSRQPTGSAGGDVAACRAVVPPAPGVTHTSSGRGGSYSTGRNPAHLAYLDDYLSRAAAAASGEDVRRVRAFAALQPREGSTSAINTYDNQVFTWGTGWGGLGGLPRVMGYLAQDPVVTAALAACGVQYLGNGQWAVVDDAGNVVTGKKEALEVIRATPALVALFVHLAEDPATRDAVTAAQLRAFLETSAQVPGSEEVSSQALFNFLVHLAHWAPGYAKPQGRPSVVQAAAAQVPGTPSADRDRQLAPLIVQGFYANVPAGAWTPSWTQLQGYALRDMKADGLDVGGDPVLSASSPPATKTAGGCGWPKSAGGPGLARQLATAVKTAGGCGQYDYPNAEVCGNWAPFDSAYLPTHPEVPVAVKVASGPGHARRAHPPSHPWYAGRAGQYNAVLTGASGGWYVFVADDGLVHSAGPAGVVDGVAPGVLIGQDGTPLDLVVDAWDGGYYVRPPGYEDAREVADEPDVPALKTAGGPGVIMGELPDLGSAKTLGGPGAAPTSDQVAAIRRGIVAAVRDGTVDPPGWSQIRAGEYDVMVTNEPLTVGGLRLPTSFDDAVAVAQVMGAILITPAISDARWAVAERVSAQPLGDSTGEIMDGAPGSAEQIVRHNVLAGPNTGRLRDGAWKEIVLVPGLQPDGRGSMAQYGFKRTDGTMFEHGEPSNHDRHYRGYSDTPTYVSRKALKHGGEAGIAEVDLLDELAAGSSIGGPLPQWLVDRLRGGVA